MPHCYCPCNVDEKAQIVEAVGTDPMEVTYQRRCANFIYVVPDGLRELMSDISREVIRVDPPNLNVFIADYLHNLMVTRENAKVAMRLIEDVGDTSELLVDLMKHTKLSRHQIDKSARIIQKTFKRLVKTRKYKDTAEVQQVAAAKMMVRLKVTQEEANKAATVIQRAYYLYKLRQERKYRVKEDPQLHLPFRHIDWQVAAQKTFDIFINIRGVRMTEYHKAATLIQAAYRGYYTRKFVKDYWNLMKKDEVNLNPDDESMKIKKDLAARVLQKFFRRVVQNIKKKKMNQFSESKQRPNSIVSPEKFNELGEILVFDECITYIKAEVDAESVSLRANTSKDFEKTRDKCARVIQGFFKKIVAQNKARYSFDQKYDTYEVDSDIFEFDEEIENLFGEEEGEVYSI